MSGGTGVTATTMSNWQVTVGEDDALSVVDHAAAFLREIVDGDRAATSLIELINLKDTAQYGAFLSSSGPSHPRSFRERNSGQRNLSAEHSELPSVG